MTVRTRFAPSPTGYMHVGNLRTALYTYLIARKYNGTFILRIEDTDQNRFIDGATDVIYKTLKQTGLVHDEGPDIGGNYGPYIQSQRREIYKEYAEKLVELGGAYYCFCQKEEKTEIDTDDVHAIPQKYDGRCSHLTKEEIATKLAAGEKYVIRQKIPSGHTSFDDEVFGHITVDNNDLDDGVLLKGDGLPTYNFANVVDDHLMEITHVVRGSEYLSSTPKYNIMYDAFGWEKPIYLHVSPVMKNQTEKLSKRHGDASFEDLINKGYLMEAIINYVALCGWSPGGEREKYSLDEMIEAFDIKGLSKSPAIFDIQKLNWLNSEYIREMSVEQFYEIVEPILKENIKINTDLKLIAELLKQRTEKLTDIADQVGFFNEILDYPVDYYINKKMKTDLENSKFALIKILGVLSAITVWEKQVIHDQLMALVEQLGLKNGQILYPMRVALSGKLVTPGGGGEIAYLLGKEETILRLETAIQLL